MQSGVLDAELATAIDQVTAGMDAVVAAGVDPVDHRDAAVLIQELEVLHRRLRTMQVEVMDRIEARGLHRFDGHASAKVMVRHVAKLSNAEAHRRAVVARALRDLPVVRAAFAQGQIGVCQVERIARAHANGAGAGAALPPGRRHGGVGGLAPRSRSRTLDPLRGPTRSRLARTRDGRSPGSSARLARPCRRASRLGTRRSRRTTRRCLRLRDPTLPARTGCRARSTLPTTRVGCPCRVRSMRPHTKRPTHLVSP